MWQMQLFIMYSPFLYGRVILRNAAVFQVLSGEAISSNVIAGENFKKKIERISENYEIEDISNADETGLFFKALPNKSSVEKFKKKSWFKIFQ